MTCRFRDAVHNHIIGLKRGFVVRAVIGPELEYNFTSIHQRIGDTLRISKPLLTLAIEESSVKVVRFSKCNSTQLVDEISPSDPNLLKRIESHLTFAVNFNNYVKENGLVSGMYEQDS